MTIRGAYFVQVFLVDVTTTIGWPSGPLPLRRREGTVYEIRADRDGRQRYVPRSALPDLLWGTEQQPRRWHRFLNEGPQEVRAERGAEFEVEMLGVEILQTSGGHNSISFAAVHGEITPSNPQLLHGFVELSNLDPIHGKAVRALVSRLLPVGVSIAKEVRRSRLMSLVWADEDGLPPVADYLSDWPVREQWLWYLATAHLPEAISVSDKALQRVQGESVHLSSEWTAFIASEGLAWVSQGPPIEPFSNTDYIAQRRFRFDTMETDALLLAELQDAFIGQVSRSLYSARTQSSLRSPLLQMRSALRAFRSMYWGSTLTERGPTNTLLERLQEVRQTPKRLAELRHIVTEATSEVAEQDLLLISSSLGILAVLGFPISTALAIWSGLSPAHPLDSLFWALGGGLAAAGLTVSLLPGLRRLVRELTERK